MPPRESDKPERHEPAVLHFSKAAQGEPVRAGRRGHPPRFCAEVAKAYADAVAAGSRSPIADVTDQLNAQGQPFARTAIRSMISRARRTDPPLLTEALVNGRPSGNLTDYARELLAADSTTKGER